ncbi:neo-calmodulin-like isoform X2 [Gigantopelta aegis]|uniref:neo-calmodulin-like isoform X2 n=1 Tax=Gigantopelta aegis TaxID=1735272 RepID=UPI001B887E37|nr:neo-calmodulin-like isoform X2 [Gigantopelta aegis]
MSLGPHAPTSKKEIEAQEDVWKEAFNLFDQNGDGQICLEELGKVIRALGFNPTEKQIKEVAKELDKDGSGTCTFEDFKQLMKEKPPSKEDFADEMLRAFKIFDKDGNNFIEPDELRHVMTQLGEPLTDEQVNLMIQCADLNKDGKLDYQEFVKWCLQPC